ncbi:MAG: hypothetical protein GW949_07900 [Spirochaetales bacterium]|nr:hypothetical protein [Spirochaetales bacterium]
MKRYTLRISLLARVGVLSLLVVFLGSCSIQKIAVGMIADTLAGTGTSGNAFMRDNDPELVGDALPFTIKLYELILEMDPENRPLILTTGSLFVMYANAFVWGPAEILPFDEFEAQFAARMRAKQLYLRGRDMVMQGVELKYPGFTQAAFEGKLEPFLEKFTKEDVPYLYWLGAGWFGAFSLDNFDVNLAINVKAAADLLLKAYEIDPEYDDRTLDEFLITFHGVVPQGYGGDPTKVEYHFNRVVELRGERSVGPYVALAQSVGVPKQNYPLFRDMLAKANEIEIEDYPDQLLLNTINLRKARWLKENEEFLFLELE